MNTKDSGVGVGGAENKAWVEFEEEARGLELSIEPAAASFMGCGRGWPEREKDRWSDQSRIISSGWSDLHTHRKVFYAGARCEQAKSVGLRLSPGVIAGQSWSYLAAVGAYWKSLVPRTYMRGFSYNPLEQFPPAI